MFQTPAERQAFIEALKAQVKRDNETSIVQWLLSIPKVVTLAKDNMDDDLREAL